MYGAFTRFIVFASSGFVRIFIGLRFLNVAKVGMNLRYLLFNLRMNMHNVKLWEQGHVYFGGTGNYHCTREAAVLWIITH